MATFFLRAGLAVVTAIIGAAGKLFINGWGYYPERWLADKALEMTGIAVSHQQASLALIAVTAIILYAILYYFLFWRPAYRLRKPRLEGDGPNFEWPHKRGIRQGRGSPKAGHGDCHG